MKLSTILFGAAAILSVAALVPTSTNASQVLLAKTATAPRSWVTLQTTTDKKVYTSGEPIQVKITATNRFSRGAYLKFSSGQRFDFSIYKIGQKDTSYTWSAARMFPMMVGSLWLKPGQSQSYDATVGDEMGSLKPGKYRLISHLTNSSGNIVAAPVDFEVASIGLTMKAQTDKITYKIGEPVKIDVSVANVSGKTNTVRFDSGMTYDVYITDAAENPVWNYGANLRFIRVLGNVSWNKNETKNYSTVWNGVALPAETLPRTLEAGRYRVQAVLQSNPSLYAEPIYIELTD